MSNNIVSDSRKAFRSYVRFVVDRPATNQDVTDSGVVTPLNLDTVLSGNLELPANTIQAISYKQDIGTGGVDQEGNRLPDLPVHAGSLVLHLHSQEEVVWSVLASVGVGARIEFSFGPEDEVNPIYRAAVISRRFSLRPEGVNATFSFANAELYNSRTLFTKSKIDNITIKRLTEASQTYKEIYEFLLVSRRVANFSGRSGQVITNPTGNEGTIVQRNQLVKQGIEKLTPDVVFKNIADTCGWPTEGIFGGRRQSTIESSHYTIETRTSFNGSSDLPIDRWIHNVLIKESVTSRGYAYQFYFADDETGKAVAHFHSKYFNVATQSIIKPDKDQLQHITYGSAAVDSEVIECNVDETTLEAVMFSAGAYVASSPNDGIPLFVNNDGTPETWNSLDSAVNNSGAFTLNSASKAVSYVPSRTTAQLQSEVSMVLSRSTNGLRISLVLLGTNKYTVGSFIRFTYYLPNGRPFPGLSDTPYQILSITQYVDKGGHTTTLELIGLGLSAENPTVNTKPPGDVIPAAAAPTTFTSSVIQRGLGGTILSLAPSSNSGAAQAVEDFVNGTLPIDPVTPDPTPTFAPFSNPEQKNKDGTSVALPQNSPSPSTGGINSFTITGSNGAPINPINP